MNAWSRLVKRFNNLIYEYNYMMEGMHANNVNEEVMENMSSFESLQNSLVDLENKLGMIANIPGFEADVADLVKSIQNLKARIESKNN